MSRDSTEPGPARAPVKSGAVTTGTGSRFTPVPDPDHTAILDTPAQKEADKLFVETSQADAKRAEKGGAVPMQDAEGSLTKHQRDVMGRDFNSNDPAKK